MQKWYGGPNYAYFPLVGDDCEIWARRSLNGPNGRERVSEYASDLIAINGPSSNSDHATDFLAETLIPHWHDKVASRFFKNMRTYHGSTMYRFTSIIATALSSLLPVVSIVVLYTVHSKAARLGIIAGFTLVFSLALSIFTTANRVENFATTAA